MTKYIFRLDDICPTMNWQNFERIKNLFFEYGVKPIIAVIPDNTQSAADISQKDAENHQYQIGQYKNMELLYQDLTYKIRGAIFEVWKKLGPVFKESVYQKALEEEFLKRNIRYESQKTIQVNYNNKKIGTYRPDFIIDDKVIIEIKKIPFITKRDVTQMKYYIQGSNYKLALLVNFGGSQLQIKRYIYDTARNTWQDSQNSADTSRNIAETSARFREISAAFCEIPRNISELPRASAKYPRDSAFWQEIKELENRGWTIAMHGYQHEYTQENGDILKIHTKSEFAGLPYQEQFEKIKKGKEILESHNIKTNIFIAPGHSFDKNTLKALKENSFNAISDGIALYPFKKYNILWIPQIAWQPRKFKCGIITFCLHPNTMQESDFENLENFVKNNASEITDLHYAINYFNNRSFLEKISAPIVNFLFRKFWYLKFHLKI